MGAAKTDHASQYDSLRLDKPVCVVAQNYNSAKIYTAGL